MAKKFINRRLNLIHHRLIHHKIKNEDKKKIFEPKFKMKENKKIEPKNNLNKKKNQKIEQKIENNLEDTKFRILNEKLYKSSSKEAFEYFKSNEDDFITYHKGFSSQSKKWPINPNDLILKSLLLPKYKSQIIADIGCGEAKIAQKLVPMGYKVYSFDLVSLNEYVTVADMRRLPLEDKFCDIEIFCLSLMNKNFIYFIVEANRVLKMDGKLLVAEISSRIVDLQKFINIFQKYGFLVIKHKNINDYFEMVTFKKVKDCKISKKDKQLDNTYDILKPCLYKKR